MIKYTKLVSALLLAVAATTAFAEAHHESKAILSQRGTFLFYDGNSGRLLEVSPGECVSYALGDAQSVAATEYFKKNGKIDTSTRTSTAQSRDLTEVPRLLCDYAVTAGASLSETVLDTVDEAYLVDKSHYRAVDTAKSLSVLKVLRTTGDYIMAPVIWNDNNYVAHLPALACSSPTWNKGQTLSFENKQSKKVKGLTFTQADVKKDAELTGLVKVVCEHTLLPYDYVKSLDFQNADDKAIVEALQTLIN